MGRLLTILSGEVEFSPSNISNLDLWLDSADSSTITKDVSDLVSQWDDKSGTGKNATATTTQRPTDTGGGLDFDGTNNYMQSGATTDWAFLHDGAGSTIFIACETDLANPDNQQTMIATFSVGGNPGIIFHLDDRSGSGANDNYRMLCYNAGGAILAQYAGNGTAPQQTNNILSQRFGVEGGATNDSFLYNGTSQNSAVDVSNTPLATDPIFPLFIGSQPNTLNKFDGLIKEVIIYKRKLTIDEHTQVVSYLSNKWS